MSRLYLVFNYSRTRLSQLHQQRTLSRITEALLSYSLPSPPLHRHCFLSLVCIYFTSAPFTKKPGTASETGQPAGKKEFDASLIPILTAGGLLVTLCDGDLGELSGEFIMEATQDADILGYPWVNFSHPIKLIGFLPRM